MAGAAPKAGAQRWAAVGVLVLLVAVASFVLITTRRVAGATEAADRAAVVSDLSQDARFYAASAYGAKVEDLYHSDENWPDDSGRGATSSAINNLTETLQSWRKHRERIRPSSPDCKPSWRASRPPPRKSWTWLIAGS